MLAESGLVHKGSIYLKVKLSQIDYCFRPKANLINYFRVKKYNTLCKKTINVKRMYLFICTNLFVLYEFLHLHFNSTQGCWMKTFSYIA